jgi:hypothetical protein
MNSGIQKERFERVTPAVYRLQVRPCAADYARLMSRTRGQGPLGACAMRWAASLNLKKLRLLQNVTGFTMAIDSRAIVYIV